MKSPINKCLTSAAIHRPFSWLHASIEGDAHADFLALTKTITGGVALCLQLAQGSNVDRATETLPILSISDAESLLLLATASIKLLEKSATDAIDDMNARAMKDAAALKGESHV